MKPIFRSIGSYMSRIIASGPLVYFPLNETSGTVAKNWGSLGAVANCNYTGVDLANISGPKGGVVPYFDGVNDEVNILTEAFNTAFSGSLGSMIVWAKVLDLAVWTDGVARHPFFLNNDQPSWIRWYKSTSANTLNYQFYIEPNSTGFSRSGSNSVDWMFLAMTWNLAQDRERNYYNGSVLGVGDYHGLGTYIAPLTAATIGQRSWKGWLAHAAIWTRELSAAEILSFA